MFTKLIDQYRENKITFEPIRKQLYEQLRANPNQVKEAISELLTFIDEKEESNGPKGWLYSLLSWHYHDYAQYEVALDCLYLSIPLLKQEEERKGLLFSYNAAMVNYIAMGVFEESVRWGYKAAELAVELKDDYYYHLVLNNIVNALVMLERFDEARETFSRVTNDSEKSAEYTIISLQILSEIEFGSRNGELALQTINDAIALSSESEQEFLNSENYRIRGEIYTYLGKLELAEEDYIRGIEASKQFHFEDIECRLYLNYGTFLTKQERLLDGEEMIQKGIQLGEKLKLNLWLSKLYKVLSENYKSQKSFEGALMALERHTKYAEKIYTLQTNIGLNQVRKKNLKNEAETYRRLFDQMSIISTIGQRITSSLDVLEISRTIYEESLKLLEVDIFGIATYEEKEETLNYEMFIEGGEVLDTHRVSIHSKTSLGAYCVKEKKEIIINDIQHEYMNYIDSTSTISSKTALNPQSIICCPLNVHEKTIGFLTIQSYNTNTYTQRDLETLKVLSSFIAIALENAKLFKELEHTAKYDFLTGAYNRAEIMKIGEALFEVGNPLSVAMLDLDYFKRINDTYGHQAGDEFLRQFVRTIQDVVGNECKLGRYGGEEFLLLLPNKKSEVSIEISEEIRQAIEKICIQYKDFTISTTVSIGVYEFKEAWMTFPEGVNKADEALYIAKYRGRNQVKKV